jgi:hypothetical protein
MQANQKAHSRLPSQSCRTIARHESKIPINSSVLSYIRSNLILNLLDPPVYDGNGGVWLCSRLTGSELQPDRRKACIPVPPYLRMSQTDVRNPNNTIQIRALSD